MANKGKRMVNEDLIKYLEAVKANNPDPSDIGGGGTDFTPTNGLEFTEVEGETYLGLTQVTVQQINGDLNQSRQGALTFNISDTTRAALTFQNSDNFVNFRISSNTGGYFGYRAESALDTPKFYFRNYWNGGRNQFVLPNLQTTEVDRTIALGIKGILGDNVEKVYAGDDGLIDFTSGYNTIPFNNIQVYDTVTIGSYPDGTPGNTSLYIDTGSFSTQNDMMDISAGDGNARISISYDTSNDTPTYFFAFGSNEVSIKEDGIYYNQTKVVSFPTQS